MVVRVYRLIIIMFCYITATLLNIKDFHIKFIFTLKLLEIFNQIIITFFTVHIGVHGQALTHGHVLTHRQALTHGRRAGQASIHGHGITRTASLL